MAREEELPSGIDRLPQELRQKLRATEMRAPSTSRGFQEKYYRFFDRPCPDCRDEMRLVSLFHLDDSILAARYFCVDSSDHEPAEWVTDERTFDPDEGMQSSTIHFTGNPYA